MCRLSCDAYIYCARLDAMLLGHIIVGVAVDRLKYAVTEDKAQGPAQSDARIKVLGLHTRPPTSP